MGKVKAMNLVKNKFKGKTSNKGGSNRKAKGGRVYSNA